MFQIFEHILTKSAMRQGQDNMSMIIIKNDLKYKNTEKIESEKVETKRAETKRMEAEKTETKKTETKTETKNIKRFKK